jgi:molybdate transport system regulatory protein
MNADRTGLTVRFRIDLGKDRALGPGKIALLEQIGASGSLSQAARDLGMSYRRAWELLESLNQSFQQRVVATSTGGRGGGGAALTPFGRALVACYRRFEVAIQARASRDFRGLNGQAPVGGSASAVSKAPVVRLSARARAAHARAPERPTRRGPALKLKK